MMANPEEQSNRKSTIEMIYGVLEAHLETEGLGDDCHSENSTFHAHFSHDRRSACTSSTTHASSNEHHVSITDHLSDFFATLLCRSAANVRISATPQALSSSSAKLDALFCQSGGQVLCIRVETNKVHA
jgi:hypothetical protein